MSQGKPIRLENFEELLDDFGQLPSRVARPLTFMEIAGYPHYENACSNILAFFMDPEGSHGLGTLVLDALASAGNVAAADKGAGGNVSVEREVSTDAGNRIDLLITSDDHAVLIENKIYASASNPFDDYAAYLDRIANGRVKHKLLLTVLPTYEGSKWGFTNLTYEEFVSQIRSLLGRYVSSADTRYLMMFLDFLNTLENLKKGSRMDQEFVKLLADRIDDVQYLFNRLKSFRVELRSKVQELESLIEVDQHPNVEHGLWRGDTAAISDNVYYKIRIADDLLVGIDARISPHGWEIQIFARDRSSHSELKQILEDSSISFEEREQLVYPNQEKDRFIHHYFDYDENLDRVRPVLQEVVDRLATSQELKK